MTIFSRVSKRNYRDGIHINPSFNQAYRYLGLQLSPLQFLPLNWRTNPHSKAFRTAGGSIEGCPVTVIWVYRQRRRPAVQIINIQSKVDCFVEIGILISPHGNLTIITATLLGSIFVGQNVILKLGRDVARHAAIRAGQAA